MNGVVADSTKPDYEIKKAWYLDMCGIVYEFRDDATGIRYILDPLKITVHHRPKESKDVPAVPHR